MTADELKQLRAHYHALQGQERVLAELAAQKHTTVDRRAVQVLAIEFGQLERDFPSIFPTFDPNRFVILPIESGWYELAAVRAHLAGVVGRLSIEVESTEPAPVTEHRDFAFIHDPQLRSILERDFVEIQKAFVSECWKSVIVLAGGALEAILLDRVLLDEPKAKASSKAPREPNIARWDLAQLIDVCMDLKIASPYVATVSEATRAYRNLVHPGNEVRTKLTFGKEEARIALTVLQVVHRDLSR